jgi:hypothetical protein
VIVIAMTMALVSCLAIAAAVAGARNAAGDLLTTLAALRGDQRHALVLARVEATRATGLRRSSADA